MKAVVCDDEAQSREEFARLLAAYAAERGVPVETRVFALPFDLLDNLEAGNVADVYLLDVYMPGMDGIRLARSLKRISPQAKLIFLTTSREHAVEAFDLCAVHYLEKPVTKQAFFAAMDRAASELNAVPRLELWCKTPDGYENLQARDICCVEAEDKRLLVRMKDGRALRVPESLKSLGAKLEETGSFISPHRSYLVNLRHIVKITSGSVVMSGDVRIPIARGESAAVKAKFMDYLLPEREKQ